MCLPFAFAFQLAQHQSALRNCRAIVFEKGRRLREGGRGSASVRQAISQVCEEWCCFPVDACEMRWSSVYTVLKEDVLIFVFVCYGGVMTSIAQSKKLLLKVLRIVVRGGACELCVLLTHMHRVIYQLITCAHT